MKIRFQDGSYKFLIITGGNFSIGHPLSKYYKSYANLAASILNDKGFPMGKIILAPMTTIAKKDRTYHAALAVKNGNIFDTANLFGFLAIILAAIKIFGGFLVTHRMLAMYKKKKKNKL